MSNLVRLRRMSSLEYGDPRGFLVALRQLEEKESCALAQTPERVRTLRTNVLKSDRERRDAAIFCVGMSEIIGSDVRFAPVEDEDFDFVATWQEADVRHFCPVQLKELPPSHLNASACLQPILDGLRRYGRAPELTVAIKFNRRGRFDPSELRVPEDVSVGGIWVFGSLDENQTEFAIWGNFADGTNVTSGKQFGYPRDAVA